MISRRSVGPLDSPFAFASLLSVGYLCLYVGLFSVRNRLVKLVVGCGIFAVILGIILAGARTAQIALLTSLLIISRRFLRSSVKLLFFTGTIFVIALSLLATFDASPAYNGLNRLRTITTVSNFLEEDSVVTRFEYWREAARLIIDNPIGYGNGSISGGVARRFNFHLGKYAMADNQYIQQAVELGFFAPALYITLLIASFCIAWQSDPPSIAEDCGSMLILGLSVYALVSGVAVPLLDAYPSNGYFWILLGGAISAVRSKRYSGTDGKLSLWHGMSLFPGRKSM